MSISLQCRLIYISCSYCKYHLIIILMGTTIDFILHNFHIAENNLKWDILSESMNLFCISCWQSLYPFWQCGMSCFFPFYSFTIYYMIRNIYIECCFSHISPIIDLITILLIYYIISYGIWWLSSTYDITDH